MAEPIVPYVPPEPLYFRRSKYVRSPGKAPKWHQVRHTFKGAYQAVCHFYQPFELNLITTTEKPEDGLIKMCAVCVRVAERDSDEEASRDRDRPRDSEGRGRPTKRVARRGAPSTYS